MNVDPRGTRFGAGITTVVLAVVLVTGNGWLLAGQALIFAIGAFAGLRAAPYGLIFWYLVRPRLGPPRELEAEPPPRFAQAVGLVFAIAGVIGYFTGILPLALIATSAAMLAAFLNAAFGFCLGCEMYVLLRRLLPARTDGPA